MPDGAHTVERWTPEEDWTLRKFYPALGAQDCVARLGGRRSDQSVQTRAKRLGLTYRGPKVAGARKHHPTEACDADLREAYRTGPRRGELPALSVRHGLPVDWLRRRAQTLGLSRQRRAEYKPWTPEEDALIRHYAGFAVVTIQQKLRAAGFSRTRAAVGHRRSVLGEHRQPVDVYSVHQVAKMLGRNPSTVSHWVRCEWLRATRVDPARVDGRPDFWEVKHGALRAFVISHPHLMDLSRVTDAEWLINLIAGRPPDGRHRVRKGAATRKRAT